MNRTTIKGMVCAILMLSLITACGHKKNEPPPITRAVLVLYTSGTLATSGTGSLIYGAQVTVHLPAGVSVKASPYSAGSSTMITDTGVVSASGVATDAELAVASYLTATAPLPYNKIDLMISKSTGFGTGEFAIVNCDIASGHRPIASDFTLSDFKVVDVNGDAIAGISSAFVAGFE